MKNLKVGTFIIFETMPRFIHFCNYTPPQTVLGTQHRDRHVLSTVKMATKSHLQALNGACFFI